MGATNDFDRQRIVLENGLAGLVGAENRLRVVAVRLAQRARQERSLEMVEEVELLAEARGQIQEARRVLVEEFHPNALGGPPPRAKKRDPLPCVPRTGPNRRGE